VSLISITSDCLVVYKKGEEKIVGINKARERKNENKGDNSVTNELYNKSLHEFGCLPSNTTIINLIYLHQIFIKLMSKFFRYF